MSISILLADDDVDDQSFFKEAVKVIDPLIKVVVAMNGNDAIKILETYHPQLIFLDINMPFKNGKDCLQIIRRDKQLKNIHIIMYTTSIDARDIHDCFNLGANLFVTKPCTHDNYVKILSGVFMLYAENGLHHTDMNHFVFNLPKGSC